jgi:hypothetical protein
MTAILDIAGRPRRGDWIQTYSGRQVFPLDPMLNDYQLIDIAAALSKLTRYNGHCLRFYSVAEHCVLLARHYRDHGSGARIGGAGGDLRTCRTLLMHDASEAYLIDVPRPIKGSLEGYKAIEHELMLAIAARFDFDWPAPGLVHRLDNAILNDEMAQVMAPPPTPWRHGGEALGVQLQLWSPDQAFAEFMRAALEFGVSA